MPSLKKRYGQHHLRDAGLCRPLLDYLRPAGQTVLEIGPGGGVLTAELIRAGARVVACEVDQEWAFTLRRRLAQLDHHDQGERPRIAVFDALNLDYSRLTGPVLVTGNLPFNVATPLIERMLPHADVVPRASFMVQKEVADRLVAFPGDAAYGALSILVRALARVRYLGTVSPGSFKPPPKVTAAFVGFELHAPPVEIDELKDFQRLVRIAFAQRRKTLRNCLTSGLGRETAREILADVGLDEKIRAEVLGLDAFVEMFRAWRELDTGNLLEPE